MQYLIPNIRIALKSDGCSLSSSSPKMWLSKDSMLSNRNILQKISNVVRERVCFLSSYDKEFCCFNSIRRALRVQNQVLGVFCCGTKQVLPQNGGGRN